MTIEEERLLLERIRSEWTWEGDLLDLKERMGIAAWDQMKAAEAESARSLDGMLGKGPFHTKSYMQGLKAELAAAIIRCMETHACEHALGGTRPLRCFLASRVVSCAECMPRFRGIVSGHDDLVTRGEDSLCDFCLEEKEFFLPVGIHVGPTILMGDMCDDCHSQVEESEALHDPA
jgi:hypothetical protein